MDGVMATNLNTVSIPSKNEEQDNSCIANVSNCSYMAGHTPPQHFIKCKNEMLKTTNIDSLPDETLYEILVHVPAQDICNAARLVCRKWYQMIRTKQFVQAHLHQSSPGLLIQHMASKRDGPIFIVTRKGRIEKSNINYKFQNHVLSSCNGLILECRYKSRNDLCIINPVTKQRFSLPPFDPKTKNFSFAIAYAAASMEYKLVCSFYDESKSQYDIAILTVGVDNDWTRRVNIQHLSQAPRMDILLLEKPICTEGFVHWAESDRFKVKGEPEYVLTLNIETEIVTQFRAPSLYHDSESLRYDYLSMGSHLTLLIGCGGFYWEVWEMKSETGEWTKAMVINLESEKKIGFVGVYELRPVGWLNFGEVLVFSVCKRMYADVHIPDKVCVSYNVRTDEIIDPFCTAGLNKFAVHSNSLVWLDLDGR